MNVNLILQIALRDIKLRYSSTRFGYAWVLLNPLLMLASLTIIFTYVMRFTFEYYQIFLILGMIVWNFFSEATSASISAVASSMGMLKKIKVPLHMIVLGSNLSAVIGFAANLIVLLILMLLFRIQVFTFLRLSSVLYFFLLFAFVISVSLAVSTVYIYFRDIVHVWNFVLFLGFWLTPVLYPERYVPAQFLRYYLLNPLARIISHLRNTVIYNYQDSLDQVTITIVIVMLLSYLCLKFYQIFSKRLGEIL
ncbi:MAG: ABC transporter permease [Nanoarchaeota archaeon]|nr:ABC transporter permease [Nanoarchaeota archaeon]